MKKILLLMLLTFSFFAIAKEKPFTIGVIYPGPISDYGYSYQHAQGFKAVQDKYGDKVKIINIETVPEGPEAQQVLTKLAREGADMIFSTSFGFMNQTVKTAQQFPTIKFEHATGYKRSENLATYSSRFYEGRYIQGLIAGHMTKKNHIGYIASFPIPEVIRGINAFEIGLHKVNPDAKVSVIWINSWYDPAKESEAARTLIDQGADILTQHTDSTAPMQIAEEKGIYAFGQASDMQKFGPHAQLTAIINDWSSYYLKRVDLAMNNKWESIDIWGGVSDDMVVMAPFHKDIPEEVQKLAQDAIDALAEGKLNIFEGELKNQQGEVVAGQGEVLTDADLLSMSYYLDLVEAKYPN